MSRLLIVIVLGCSSALPGCATQGLQSDQDKIRHTLLDLYTNQIMENLIREHNGLPIVHLDYINAFSQLTIKETAGINNNLVTNNPGVLATIAGSTASVVYSTVNTVTGNLTADRANQVSVSASPVITSDDVYNAYREFLDIPGSLQETCKPPAPGLSHLCKKCGQQYYWVPAEYKKAFLALALKTTAQRAQPLAGPDPFWSVNIVEVVNAEEANPQGIQKLRVRLNKKIPSDIGRIEITGPSSSAQASKAADVQTPKTPAPSAVPPAPGTNAVAVPPAGGGGANSDTSKTSVFEIMDYQKANAPRRLDTDEIYIYFDPTKAKGKFKTPKEMQSQVPMPASVYLDNHRPTTPAVNDVQSRIEFQLQQIQFGQQR